MAREYIRYAVASVVVRRLGAYLVLTGCGDPLASLVSPNQFLLSSTTTAWDVC